MKPIVLMLILATAVMSAASQTSAQKPTVDGPWYGTLSGPDGTPLEVVLQLQKQTSGWTGTLNIGGGTPAPLWNVTVSGDTLSFTVGVGESRQPNPAVSARLADGGETLDIVFTR